MTVFETTAYLARATKLLSEDEHEPSSSWLHANRRRVSSSKARAASGSCRFAVGGRGKSGGVRVVY
jgi:hypothetical protein